MTDPKRLSSEEGSAEERRLLQAGVAEQPPADGAARLALALAVPLFPNSPPLPPGGAGGGLSNSPPLPPGGAGGGLSSILGSKLALTGALLAGAGAALTLTLMLRSPAPAPAPARTNVPTAAPAQAPQTDAPDLAAPTAHSLADEVARLDGARRALAARTPDLALDALDSYRSNHPQGTLAPEALRLRVEAWLAKGDLKRARALAREFLRTYPQSPHAATLRRIAERELNDEAAQEP